MTGRSGEEVLTHSGFGHVVSVSCVDEPKPFFAAFFVLRIDTSEAMFVAGTALDEDVIAAGRGTT